MKNLLLVLLLCFSAVQAQVDHSKFVDEPKWVLKIAPRIFMPKITYEKLINENSSFGIEIRAHSLLFPKGVRMEGFYRKYFNDKAPLGFYLQPKLAFGYFTYRKFNYNTNGFQVGGGFNVGGQFNIGKKNAVIDVYAGLQWIAPVYLNYDTRFYNGGPYTFDYNFYHYTIMAFPLDVGIRFGFIKMRKVPATETFDTDGFY